MTSKTKTTLHGLAALATALLLASPAVAADTPERWFHVRVHETGHNPVKVTVNVPVELMERVLEVLPEEAKHEVTLEFNEEGLTVEDLREIWQEVRESPDATFVTVETEDETVKVRKEGEYLLAKTTEAREGGSVVDLRIPLSVVDALFSGPDQELDLPAAVRALAEHGTGDVVTVRDEETTVRIWVDDKNEAE